MPLPPEVSDWIARSEVDHVGPFVNAWAAFNAWYRHISGSSRDRDGLDYVRTHPNSVRGAIMPMLDPQTHDTPDAIQFKQLIANLHGTLESFRLETMHKGAIEHVSFRSVPLRNGKPLPQSSTYSRITYQVTKANGQWISTVTNRSGVETARIEQADYDLAIFQAHGNFVALPTTGKGQLRALYIDCNPRPMSDLLTGNEPAIVAGTIHFRCTCEELFGGVIETIYRMRNMLLHGELKPDAAALACYEPAYRLLRRMLKECR